MKMPLLIAHRGGKFWEGDNFEYISESIKDGADIVELDIRVSNGKYIVQHPPFGKVQGNLEDALKLLENAAVYLDIKDKKIDINSLVSFVRKICTNYIIVGSFDLDLLRSIKDKNVEKNLHCVFHRNAIANARSVNAGWINPIPYLVTDKFAKDIQDAGLKFVPGGNQIFRKHEIFRNQLKNAELGAHAISTFHVKEMRELLLAQNGDRP